MDKTTYKNTEMTQDQIPLLMNPFMESLGKIYADNWRIINSGFGDYIFLLDWSGRCIAVDGAAALQYTLARHPIGQDYLDIFIVDDRQIIDQALSVLKNLGEYRFTCRISISDTDTKVLDTVGMKIRNSSEQPGYFLLVSRDITELDKLRGQYLQSQKMESLGTLTAGIAHDFNNILSIILGYITRVDQFRRDEQKFRSGINAILRAVERGLSITKIVLSFARKSDITLQPTDLNQLCVELKHLIDETFPRTIDCLVNLTEPLLPINANPHQIHQALMNLCTNARDAMMDAGTITIGTRNIPQEAVQGFNSAGSHQWYVALIVSDTGCGMVESTRREIFNPFYTTKGNGQGTGIGLAVVQEILKIHEGIIRVESTPGAGSTFTLLFPAITDLSQRLPNNIRGTLPICGGTETILVVEDEIALSTLLRDALLDYGYTVLTARDGKEAIDIFQKALHDIDLVVVDIGLPRINGFEILKKMKLQKKNLKVICSTGYIVPNLDEKIRAAGFDSLVRKPSNMEDILKVIRQVLDAD